MEERVKSAHDSDLVFAVDPQGNLITVPKSFPMERKHGFRWATAGEVPPELVAPLKLADVMPEVPPAAPLEHAEASAPVAPEHTPEVPPAT